jgi:hypothetical protein
MPKDKAAATLVGVYNRQGRSACCPPPIALLLGLDGFRQIAYLVDFEHGPLEVVMAYHIISYAEKHGTEGFVERFEVALCSEIMKERLLGFGEGLTLVALCF